MNKKFVYQVGNNKKEHVAFDSYIYIHSYIFILDE